MYVRAHAVSPTDGDHGERRKSELTFGEGFQVGQFFAELDVGVVDVEGGVEEGDTGAGVVDDLVAGGCVCPAGVSGGQILGSGKRDGRKVVRGCGFLESAVHGGRVAVSDPFEEKDEGIDGSGGCTRVGQCLWG